MIDMKDTTNRISFTEQIRIALSKPLWYKSLFQQSWGKHLCYFLVLIVLITVIQYVIPLTAYLQSMGGLKELITERFPQFTFEQGQLDMELPFELNRDGVYLYIDTSVDAYTQADAEQKEATLDDGNTLKIVYMVSRTNVVCNQALAPLDLSSFNMITLNNQMVYQMAPGYLIVMGVANLIYNMIAYLVSALFFALFGYLMNRALKLNLKFGQIYLIAMYAKSVEILLESVLQVIGFSILYYVGSIVGIFITCSYMTRGMSSMLVRASDGRKGE